MTVFEGPKDRTVTSFEVPEGVTRIRYGAFYGCTNLISVKINEGVETIDHGAFRDCVRLISVKFPKSLTSIQDRAFKNCSSLASIKLPESVAFIGIEAFQNCASLTSIKLPESVTFIGMQAFQDCASLTSIVIPDQMTIIHDSVFSGCSSLTTVKMPDNLVTIVDFAFDNCVSLTSIVIPYNVETISEAAFYECTSLEEISFLNRDIEVGPMLEDAIEALGNLKRVFVYPSRVKEFQECFNELFLEARGQRVEARPLPATIIKQLLPREFIYMSNKNTKKYTANQRNWIATFILAAYAASRMDQQQLPHLPSELVHMILEMVRRADADNKDNADTTTEIIPLEYYK